MKKNLVFTNLFLFLLLTTFFITVFSLIRLFTRNKIEGFRPLMRMRIPESSEKMQTQIPESSESSEKIKSEGIDNIENIFIDIDNTLKSIPGIFDKISIDFTILPETKD